MTTSVFLTFIVLLLAVLVAIVAFNMYKENQYRQKMRRQFGHADQDALLGSRTQSVRDGQSFEGTAVPLRRSPPVTEYRQPDYRDEPVRETQPQPQPQPMVSPADKLADVLTAAPAARQHPEQPAADSSPQLSFVLVDERSAVGETSAADAPKADKQPEKTVAADSGGRRPLIDLEDLHLSELLWFDSRFDFMAYVSLYEPKELHALPRLSGRHRFQIIGCTRDGRFQTAEPIPGVCYQAFVIGLQAISRNGLAGADELQHFCGQVEAFAERMNGCMIHEDILAFLEAARPLDELCARVDQTIAIHLVSHASILGTELRSTLEKQGFRLLNDGSFGLSGRTGETKYSVVALDGSAFTDALLSSQPYKGFSMLFDITRVADGESNFNEFMNLAVALSSQLELELVDDQIQRLSADWLKEVQSYVSARQEEMQAVGIEPGSTLAKRLFS